MKKITLYFLLLLLNLASFTLLVGYVGDYELLILFDEDYALYGIIAIYILSFILFLTVKVKSSDERFLSDFEVFGSDGDPLDTDKLVIGRTEVRGPINFDEAVAAAVSTSLPIDKNTEKAIETIDKNTHSIDSDVALKTSIGEIISKEIQENTVKEQEALIGPIIEKKVLNKLPVEVIDFPFRNNNSNKTSTTETPLTSELLLTSLITKEHSERNVVIEDVKEIPLSDDPTNKTPENVETPKGE